MKLTDLRFFGKSWIIRRVIINNQIPRSSMLLLDPVERRSRWNRTTRMGRKRFLQLFNDFMMAVILSIESYSSVLSHSRSRLMPFCGLVAGFQSNSCSALAVLET